jgi:hypothetical protein
VDRSGACGDGLPGGGRRYALAWGAKCRPAGSTLSFRVGANGPVGLQYTGYVLKLRDNATGEEVYAGAFGRRKVQQACESQGWSFS